MDPLTCEVLCIRGSILYCHGCNCICIVYWHTSVSFYYAIIYDLSYQLLQQSSHSVSGSLSLISHVKHRKCSSKAPISYTLNMLVCDVLNDTATVVCRKKKIKRTRAWVHIQRIAHDDKTQDLTKRDPSWHCLQYKSAQFLYKMSHRHLKITFVLTGNIRLKRYISIDLGSDRQAHIQYTTDEHAENVMHTAT